MSRINVISELTSNPLILVTELTGRDREVLLKMLDNFSDIITKGNAINVQKKEYCCISEPVEEEVRGDLELDDVPLAQCLEMLKNRTSNEDEDLLDDMPLIQRLQLEKKILKIDCK
ncbi:hypothetical protein RN001_002783 [Aquatica leii]|uniref:Uncharacterized protein n=1 Tax=Aquatica leii TaxID=1421715 RepID=A0AAN7PHD1_9COLE|nr:hypothetical protein RN001_002783 [Aquatica leii]